MVRAVPIGILRQILLVIVGAEAFLCTEITELPCRGPSIGRLSVDVDVDPPVDQASVRSEQRPSLTYSNGMDAPAFNGIDVPKWKCRVTT
jgi:hypothetical protein